VKSISPPPRKQLLKLGSMELQATPQVHFMNKQLKGSMTPKTNPFEGFSFSSFEKSPSQNNSKTFFNSTGLIKQQKKSEHGKMYEMSDMSKASSKNDIMEKIKNHRKDRNYFRSNSLDLEEEDETHKGDRSKRSNENKIRLSSNHQFRSHELHGDPRSTTSLEMPFFMNMSPNRMALQGLKRPSQEFEMLKMETPRNRPKKRNLIRPTGGFPRFVVLFGALLLHFAFGYIYCWGSISTYLAFFFKEDYQQSYYLDVASYSTLIFLAITLGYTFTENLVNSFGFRKSSVLCFVCIFLMMMLCSWTTTPVLYSIIPTFVVGFFLGLAYHIPYFCAVQYFAHKSTLLKGAFYVFDGLGAFYFACWSYMYLELNTTQPRLEEGDEDFYPKAIIKDIPGMIQWMGIQLLAIGVVGSLTMKPRFNFVEKDWSALHDKEEVLLRSRNSLVTPKRRGGKALFRDLKHALMSPASRNLFQIVVFSSILGTYYLCSYKIVGLQLGYNDSYLTLMGSIGMIVMSAGKVAALIAHRKMHFRSLVKYIMIIQALLGICATGAYQYFLPYFIPLMFVNGFMNALVIEEVIFAFSDDLECPMIAVMMMGLTVSNFTGFTLVKVGEYIMSHRLINIVLILPLIRAYLINKKYSGGEVRENSSVAELEVARILED